MVKEETAADEGLSKRAEQMASGRALEVTERSGWHQLALRVPFPGCIIFNSGSTTATSCAHACALVE
jgi:hypothetical protein